MFTPPSSTSGNVAGSLALLGTGGAIGAVLGYRASPPPATNQIVGAWDGGTLGVLAASAGAFGWGFFRPQWKRFGETAALLGVGGVVATSILGMAKTAAAKALPAAPSGPTPAQSTGRILQPIADGQPLGSRTFNAGISDSGSTVQLAVGDTLNITLPHGTVTTNISQGYDWFAFTDTGAPANGGYQGLKFKNETTTNVVGGQTITYSYQGSQVITPAGNGVQIVFQLLPIDASGNPIPGSQPSATFILFIGVGPAQ